MDVTDDAQGPLDPRIQIELENLNTATDDINKLEIELDEAETSFKHWQSESLKKLIGIMNKIGGGHIEKARCYYDALKLARQAQFQSQHQAHLFERASEIHATAKETVALAEAEFISHKHEWNFDQAWQDMLNHATIKVRDAEDKKAICGREHQIKTMLFEEANKKAQQLEEKYRRSIIKARPFFDQQEIHEQEVLTQRAKISCLEKAIKEAKRAYSHSFRALEEISNEIHQQRRDYVMMVSGPREPGVGAELISSEENFEFEKKRNSMIGDIGNAPASDDVESNSHGCLPDNMIVSELRGDHVENIGGRSVDGRESTSNQWELELQASLEKLNTLTFGDRNWDSQMKTVNLSTISNCNSDNSSDCQSNIIVNSSTLDQAMQYDYIRSKKLPVDFQISIERRNISLNNAHEIDNNYGWQSLTQSPINSIPNRSKIDLKNDLAKSLNHSPVNVGLNFSRTETEANLPSANNSRETTIMINSNIIDDIILLKNNQKDLNNTKDNTESIVPTKKEEITSLSLNDMEKQLYDKVDDKNSNCSNINSLSSNCLHQRLTLNEKYDNHRLENSSGIKFVDNPKFKEASCKISSVRELPLLSMFATSLKRQTSRDKSCSLINLSDKQNLKSLLDDSLKRNIQAISVEKLANARHVLMSKHIDTKSEF